jgi:SAM-dependent methyltransferase
MKLKSFTKSLLRKTRLLEPASIIYWSVRPRTIYRNLSFRRERVPDGLPVPPLKLRARVWGEYADIRLFLEREGQIARLLDVLTQCGARVEEFESILDFGCGAGRAVRQFPNLKERLPKAKIYGTDINPSQISWCSRNLPFAQFKLNAAQPPLDFLEEMFDFIYTFSVFTHLPESHQLDWLNEMWRVLKPGGYFLLTTCGDSYFETLNEDEKKRFRAGQLVIRHGELAGSPTDYNDCIAFHPVEHVEQKLADGFEVAYFSPGAVPPSGPQYEMDHFFLRKPLA